MYLLQVTLLAGATPLVAPSSTQTPTQNRISFQRLMVQNNSAHVCRVGDVNVSATAGLALAAGNTTPQPPLVVDCPLEYSGDLSEFYLFGTQGDVIDVMVIT